MIFQDWEKVLSGTKTQTRRRVVQPWNSDNLTCDFSGYLNGNQSEGIYAIVRAGMSTSFNIRPRTIYKIGKTYAVQPARGKKSVGRILLKSIRREDVREISESDVKAEGFENAYAFHRTWIAMHDNDALWFVANIRAGHLQINYGTDYLEYIQERPAEYYQAWVLEFELVEGSK